MPTATNPQTGEIVYLDEATGQWLPAKTASNPETGEKVVFDGKGWVPLTPAPAAAASPAAAAGQPVPPAQSLETELPPTDPAGRTTIAADGSEGWEPGPAVAAATAPAGQPADFPISDMGVLPTDTPMAMAPPTASAPPGSALRTGKIVGQAAGSGLTNALMFPLDVPAYVKGGIELAGRTVTDPIFRRINQAAGATVLPTSLDIAARPESQQPPSLGIPSDRVKQGASWIGKQLGYEQAVPETTGEKLLSNVVEFGTEAATGAGVLSRLARAREAALQLPGAKPLVTDKFIRPYAANPVKTVVGDTAGGATAGAALTGSQEMPDWLRDMGGGAVGNIADLTAMLAGGVSGGTLASAAMRSPTTAGQAFRASRPSVDITVDPVTGAGVSNRVADDTAALLQSITSGNPRDVAAEIAARIQGFKDQGLPVPTTGLIPDDLGLASLEKRQRTRVGPGNTQQDPSLPAETREQYSFAKRDAAQRQAASEQVQTTQQPNVDQTVFQSRAADRAQMELDARQREVDQAAGGARSVQTAREAPANELAANVGQTPGASSNIFDTYASTRTLERDRSNALYARPEWTEQVMPIDPLFAAVDEIRTGATGAAPITPRAAAIIERIETAREQGTLTGRELSILNKDIEGEITLALRDGQDFRQLKALKDGIAETVTQLPASSPPRAAFDAARANTAERIAPNFREGAGGALDTRLKTNPGQVYPETAGAGFLNRGQDAEQLMRIAGLRGNTQEVATNARAIVLDRLAQAGVVKNGAIDADKLTQWRNVRTDVINAIPGLGDEINGMIRDARRGAGKASQYAEEIAAAEKRLGATAKDIQAGPVGKIADKTPQEAVGTIMSSPNAAKNMTELRAKMGNNPDAEKSLKAAVADHFADRVKQLDTSLDNPEAGVNLQKLVKDFNKHRETLVAAGFTPDELNALQRAQTALMPLTKRNVQATVGSTTAESSEAVMRPLELVLKVHYGTLKGGSVFRNMKQMLKLAKGDTGSAVEQLATRAMFDPELAQVLLTRDIKKAGTPAWNTELQKLMRRNEIIKDVVRENEPPEKEEQP